MTLQEVCHKWAHGESAYATNLHTDGVNLWSYSTVIAKKFGKIYVVMNGRTSATTSKHVVYAERAIPVDATTIFTYADGSGYWGTGWNDVAFRDIPELVNHLVGVVKRDAKEYETSRKIRMEGNFSYDVKQIRELYKLKAFKKSEIEDVKTLNIILNDKAVATGLYRNKPIIDAVCGKKIYQAYLDRTASLRKRSEKIDAEREKARKLAELKRIELDNRRKEYLQKYDGLEAYRMMWYDGIDSYPHIPYGTSEKEFYRGGNVLLKLNDNGDIVTSKGIKIDVKFAKVWWGMIQRGTVSKGFEFKTLSGRYTAHSYENGVLTAGCHQIALAEMERIMKMVEVDLLAVS